MRVFILLLCACLASAVHAESNADEAWVQIVELRKGPGMPPDGAPEEAVRMARAHLSAQEKALGDFLTAYPADPRRFEANIEFAAVSSALGASLSDRQRIEKSLQRLSALENADSTPSKYKADAAFQRITTTMQTVNLAAAGRPAETAEARGTILNAAGNFASRYPEDRRAARLLAEAATLFDDQPSRKRKVLEQASGLARDEGTRQRIADDLKRLGLLGRAPSIAFPTIQGDEFSLASQRGRMVVLIFWAGWSPPSVAWLAEFAAFARQLPPGRVTIATVSLDRTAASGKKVLQSLGIAEWPSSCDGNGWDNSTARQLGINALPTVFIFDAEGRLRTLNARDNYRAILRDLLAEKPSVTR